MKRFLLLLIGMCFHLATFSQDAITDMAEPTLSGETAVLEGMIEPFGNKADSVRIYVFDLLAKEGHTDYAVIDSSGYFRFEIQSGTTVAVSLFHGKESEGFLLVEPGATTSVTLSERGKTRVWQFGGTHSEWNNEMNRLPQNARYNSLYNEVIANWKAYTEDGDEFRFKEEVGAMQRALEARIMDCEAGDEVKAFNLLASKLYYMELLSGYAMTLNQQYLQRGMDRSVSRDFYKDAVATDFLRFNALLYTPMGSRLKTYATLCNEQRGGHFTYPAFLDKIDYARKGMAYLSDGRLLNDRQLDAIARKTPELAGLINSRNEALREQKREQLRNPMYHIRYIDDDLSGRHVFDAIRDQYEGRIVVLDFWATWCMPCRMAMENMKPLKEAYKDKIAFVYLTGETSSEDTWRQLIPTIKGDHFYITDRQWRDICKQLKVSSIPAYLVIDWNGLISKQFSGFPGNESIAKELDKLLKEKAELEAKEAENQADVETNDTTGHATSDESSSHPLSERDISVRQGYQTVGRNERRALLLRINIPDTLTAAITKLYVRLKGNTSKYIENLTVFQSGNAEFYADESPKAVGQGSADSGDQTIELNDVTLSNGNNYLYVTATMKADARLGDTVDAALTGLEYSFNHESHRIDVSTGVGDPAGEAKIFAVRSLAYIPTTDGCQYYRIPAMTLDKEGNILVACDRRYGSNADLGNHKIDVSVRRSEDGGRTWSAQQIIATGDGSSASDYGYGDPALARTNSGRLICVMAAGSLMYWNGMRHAAICLSDDNGLTWTAPRQLYTSRFTDAVNGKTDELGFFGNFISSGKGLTTNDGTVMFTNNCLTNDAKSSPQCYILSSTDEGETWTMGPANAYAGCDESKLEQLNDGRLLVSVRQNGNRGFNTGSSDASQWGTAWRNSQISGNACNADILYFSRKTNGERDIMIHSYVKSSSRENLTLAMSIDEGRNWVDFMNIQPGGAAYSTMVRLANGDLAILFEDESYSVGNGYALTFLTVTQEQINAFADETK